MLIFYLMLICFFKKIYMYMINTLLILDKVCIENLVLSQVANNTYFFLILYIIYILRMEITLGVITIQVIN